MSTALAAAAACALASGAAAQVAANRNARSIFAADPGDARSIWVNPGALGLAGTLSVYADVTIGMEPPYESGSPISQMSLGFNSYFLAVSYQFDRLPNPLGGGTVRGYAVRVALWGQRGRLGAAGASTWYSGGDGGVGFDAGVAYRAAAMLDLGGVIANIGQPSVRGTDLRVRFRPAVTLHTPSGAIALQAQGDIGTDQLWGFAFGTSIRLAPLQLTVRLDTDGGLARQSVALGISFGGESRVGTLVTGSGDLKVLDAASLHLSSERSNKPRRSYR